MLAHALIIGIAKVNNVSKYESYRKCQKIRPAIQNLFETTNIDLPNGAGIPELHRFLEYFAVVDPTLSMPSGMVIYKSLVIIFNVYFISMDPLLIPT